MEVVAENYAVSYAGSSARESVEKSEEGKWFGMQTPYVGVPLKKSRPDDHAVRKLDYGDKKDVVLVKKASPSKSPVPVIAKLGGMDVPPKTPSGMDVPSGESYKNPKWSGSGEKSSGSWQGWTPYRDYYPDQTRNWSSAQRGVSWDSSDSPRKRYRPYFSPKDYKTSAKRSAAGKAAIEPPEWLCAPDTCMFWPFAQMENLEYKLMQAHLGEEFVAVAMGHLSRRLCSEFKMKNLERQWLQVVDPKGYYKQDASQGIKVIHCTKHYYLSKSSMGILVDRIAEAGWLQVCVGKNFRGAISECNHIGGLAGSLGDLREFVYSPEDWYMVVRNQNRLENESLSEHIGRILTQSGLCQGRIDREPSHGDRGDAHEDPGHSHH